MDPMKALVIILVIVLAVFATWYFTRRQYLKNQTYQSVLEQLLEEPHIKKITIENIQDDSIMVFYHLENNLTIGLPYGKRLMFGIPSVPGITARLLKEINYAIIKAENSKRELNHI